LADPYARRAEHARDRPPGEAPWLAAVLERGGVPVEELAATQGADAPFLAIPFAGSRVLAPIARLDHAAAALVIVLESGRAPAGPELDAALTALADFDGPLYAIKHGHVGGPVGSPGCVEVDRELIEAVLDGERAGEVGWELDPDFEYDVAARAPGLDGDRADALCPRLLYAAHDRVYEHAETVVRVKRERREQLEALCGPKAPAALAAATGWPVEPTGGSWKDG
jgi:hypothetical protein